MSQPREPSSTKLVIRFLFHDPEVQELALRRLAELFGPLDFVSAPGPFPYTSYYDAEMGVGLLRQTASFVDLVAPDFLPEIKLQTNEIEKRLSCDGKRQVNIDPGILSEERFVLATGKNFTHRIYLRAGIYADLTLIYQKGGYRALPWTYPDYQEPEFLHFLGVMRKKLRFQRDGRLPL
ncbi:MAG: DUF4416 family protein [Desulfobacteraceae bacterium]|nr:DUF4416 family protein [Desulfobacteraceae bacterium]